MGVTCLEMEGRKEAVVAASSAGLDPMYMACSLFRRRRLEECVEVCTKLLEKNPFDQVCERKSLYSSRYMLLRFSPHSRERGSSNCAH